MRVFLFRALCFCLSTAPQGLCSCIDVGSQEGTLTLLTLQLADHYKSRFLVSWSTIRPSFNFARSLVCLDAGRHYPFYIPWPFPPVWGGSRQHKRTTKTMEFYFVLLAMTRDPAEFGWHCLSNTAHPPSSSTTYVAS